MSLAAADLLGEYRSGRTRPSELIASLIAAIEAIGDPIWIARVPNEQLLARARRLDDG